MPIGNWKDDPVIIEMDEKKIAFLSKLFEESRGKNKDSLLPFLMSASGRAGKAGVEFTDRETAAIIKIWQQSMTPEEKARVRNLLSMLSKLPKKPV